MASPPEPGPVFIQRALQGVGAWNLKVPSNLSHLMMMKRPPEKTILAPDTGARETREQDHS